MNNLRTIILTFSLIIISIASTILTQFLPNPLILIFGTVCFGMILIWSEPVAGIWSILFFNTLLSKSGFSVKYLPFHLNWVDIYLAIILIITVIKVLFRPATLNPLKGKGTIFILLFSWGLFSFARGLYYSVPVNLVIDEFLRQFIYPLLGLLIIIWLPKEHNYLPLLLFFFLPLLLLAAVAIGQRYCTNLYAIWGTQSLRMLGYPTGADFQVSSIEVHGRVGSTFLSFNSLGQYLSAAGMLLLIFFPRKNKWSEITNSTIIVTGLIIIFTIGLTQSRSAWLGLSMGLIILGILKLRKFFWLVPVLLVILILTINVFEPLLVKRLNSFFSLRKDETTQIRTRAVSAGLPLIKEKPFLGYGLGMITAKKFNVAEMFYQGLDCFYIKYWVTHGLIGLFLYLFLPISLIGKSLIFTKPKQTLFDKPLLYGSVIGLATLLVGALFDSMLMSSTYMNTLYWFYVGLGINQVQDN